jgi:hypothetical protein
MWMRTAIALVLDDIPVAKLLVFAEYAGQYDRKFGTGPYVPALRFDLCLRHFSYKSRGAPRMSRMDILETRRKDCSPATPVWLSLPELQYSTSLIPLLGTWLDPL